MSGHIRRRGAGWEIKYEAAERDPATGKRQTRYVSFKGTKKQAQVELARLVTEAEAGQTVEPTRSTVAEFLDRWVRDWATGNTSPKTLERYRQLIRNQLVPQIGRLQIQKLRTTHLAEAYATLLRGGLSARTVGHVHRVTHRALGHAVRWGLVRTNVASEAEPPRVEETEIEILTADQVAALLDRFRGMVLYPIIVTALATGMRRGEVLALQWRDVDLNAATLRVERSLEETRSHGLRFKAPKTKRGRRMIALPAFAVAELRRHWAAQQQQRLVLGLGRITPDALVFPTLEGKPRRPDGVSKEFAAALRGTGIAASMHVLRHIHASALIAEGVDVLTLSRRLGHATPAITLNVYGHLYADMSDKVAAAAEAMFSRVGAD
jgi:integrase